MLKQFVRLAEHRACLAFTFFAVSLQVTHHSEFFSVFSLQAFYLYSQDGFQVVFFLLIHFKPLLWSFSCKKLSFQLEGFQLKFQQIDEWISYMSYCRQSFANVSGDL